MPPPSQEPRGNSARGLSHRPGPDASVAGLEEIESLRGEGARFFRDGDLGAHVVQLYTDPISYREGGEWRAIDSNVVSTDGGFTNAANSFDVFFPDRLNPARPVVLTYPEGALSFSLVRANPASAAAAANTVTYAGVYPGTDLEIDVTGDGIKERAIVRSADGSGRLSYRVETQGLDLALEDGGSVTVRHEGDVFGSFPPAFAVDSSSDVDSGKPATTYDVEASLRSQGPNTYLLDYEVDDAWMGLAERVYPITIDPTFVPTRCEGYPDPCPAGKGIPLLKDTYVRQGVTTPQDQKPYLRVEKTSGSQARAFMTFDFRQEVRKVGDLVYDADFDAFVDFSANPAAAKLELRRITEDWNSQATWGSLEPLVDPKVWDTDDGCSATSCKDGWTQWDVKSLMQYWIDNHVPSNHGWEISMRADSDSPWKEYASGESGAAHRPYVNVWVNAMPGTKDFAMDDPDWPKLELAPDAIPNATVLETATPKLEIKELEDPNNDDIVVRYQVSKASGQSGQSFADGIVYDTGWIDQTHSHTVPSGYLTDGTYYWRVRASDLCKNNPYWDVDEFQRTGVKVCDDMSGDLAHPNERPTSEIRSFVVRSNNAQTGKDPRWTMWSRGLGNGMELSVNQANGNGVLEYPVDSLGTPQRPLEVGLTYNSQKAMQVYADKDKVVPGLPPGWELAAGPSVAPDQMPVRLKPLTYPTPAGDKTYGVAVTYQSGRRDVFAESGGGLFTQAGPLAATVRSAGNDGWTMTTYSGGTYVFSLSGTLLQAHPSSATATTPGFEYEVVGDRLRSVTDPLGRRLAFTYGPVAGLSGDSLKTITAFEDQPDTSKRLTWSIEYSGGKVASIQDPDNAMIEVGYDSSNRLTQIFDGEESVKADGKATALEYSTTDFGGNRPAVSKVSLPVADTIRLPANAAASRTYGATSSPSIWTFDYEPASSTSNLSKRTVLESPRGPETDDPNDFKVTTDFNDIGLAILQTGPRVDGDFAGWPTTAMVWDFKTGNLLCVREPAANALASHACAFPDGLQTEYEYQARAPYLLTKVTGPADVANGPRLVTRYGYDEGAGFRGLQAHYYDNTALKGLPAAVDTTPTVSSDWGDGEPAQLVHDSEFSVRYFGEWIPGHADGTKDYEFRLTAEDDARLIVGKDVLVDCISGVGTSLCKGTTQHVVTARGVGPAAARIVVELRAVTGPARVKLEWKRPDNTYEVVPEAALRPAADVLTSEKVGTATDAGAFSTTTYEYPLAKDKLRGLPAVTKLVGGAETLGSHQRVVSYTYDEHGRVLAETDATGQPITHVYEGPCETSTTDRVLLVTTRTCNLSGDVENETVKVGGRFEGNEPVGEESRPTRTTYTRLGRVDRISFANGGYVDYDYDLAGRLRSKTVLETAGVTRVIDYVRNARGWVVEKRLPDPDGPGGVARPSLRYRYDSEGNRIVTVDERAHEWIEEYDAGNRRELRRDPLDNEWTWDFDAAGVTRKKTNPQGVEVHMTYDAQGRLRSRTLGSLAKATRTFYDLRGGVKKTTDPDDVETSFEYDAAGNVVKETVNLDSRTFDYDGSGFLTRQSNFRGHDTYFGYDGMGHLTSVELPGEADEDTTTTHVLNEAGEREKTLLPGDGGVWLYDYDEMGRLKRETDPSGVIRKTDYNLLGEILETEDGGDYKVSYFYDRLGRVDWRSAYRTVATGTPVETVDFSYDEAGNMTSAAVGGEAVTATYDDAGRLSTATSRGKTTTFDYAGSLLHGRTDAAGETTYAYEADTGRIHQISGPFDATVTTFDYKPSGRLWHTWESTDLKTTYAYDGRGRLETKTVTDEEETETYASFSTEYNADSQVTLRTTTIHDETLSSPDNGTWLYTYDEMGRLDTATDPDEGFFDYEYDGAGNRTLVEETRHDAGVERVTSAVTEYDGAQPEKTTTTVTVGGVAAPPVESTYSHDAAGNLTRIDGPAEWRSFGYDHWGRMRTASKGVPDEAALTKYVYSYDALDRTTQKATSAVAAGIETTLARELYWHAGLSEELVHSSLRGPGGVVDVDTVVTSYAYRNGEPYAVQRKTGVTGVELSTSLLGTDPHGDVVYSMNQSDELQSITSYDPWGEVRTQVGDDGMLGFQSDPTDPDTGLVDMEARNYLPELGRFITKDSYAGEMTDPLSLNRYAYGLNNPVSMFDPTGHSANKASGGGGCACSDRADDTSDEVLPTPNPSPGPCKDYACSRAVIATNAARSRLDPHPSFITAGMDGFGFVPFWGDLLDGIRCTVQGGSGDVSLDTALLCAAVVPGPLGWASGSGKMGRRAAAFGGEVAEASGIAGTILRRLPVEDIWGNSTTLERHFLDHAAELGLRTVDDYAIAASDFLQRGIQDGYWIKVDPKNGVIRMFDSASNTFGSFNADGTIRTFFKPTSATYWSRQPGVSPW